MAAGMVGVMVLPHTLWVREGIVPAALTQGAVHHPEDFVGNIG